MRMPDRRFQQGRKESQSQRIQALNIGRVVQITTPPKKTEKLSGLAEELQTSSNFGC
jgi:hypothetical protein